MDPATAGEATAKVGDNSPGSSPKNGAGCPTVWWRVAPALGLFFLAPMVGEYLLGNVPFSAIGGMLVLAPMYGGGAVLIREAARRAGRGWPTILVLALAYGVLQPGLIDLTLFSPPTLEGLDYQDAAYIPMLGVSAAATVSFSVGHAVWSISVPIAIVETFVPERRTTPWLGKFGLMVTGVVFLLGSTLIFSDAWQNLPTLLQMIGVTALVAALIFAALLVDKRPRLRIDRPAPNPWVVGVVSFVTASVFFARNETWLGVAVGFVLIAAMVVVIARWSRCTGWGAAHRLVGRCPQAWSGRWRPADLCLRRFHPHGTLRPNRNHRPDRQRDLRPRRDSVARSSYSRCVQIEGSIRRTQLEAVLKEVCKR